MFESEIFDKYQIQFDMLTNIASKRQGIILKLRQEVEDLKKEKEILANIVSSYLKEEIERHEKEMKDYEIV